MSRLFLILLLACVVSATRCFVKDDKDEPEIHVVRLGSQSGESDDSEVVTLDIPDSRRKRQADKPCEKDNDCLAGHVCVPYLGCIRGHRRSPPKKITPV